MSKRQAKQGGSGTKEAVNPVTLQSYLKGTTYPSRKQDLVDRALENGAPDEVVELLESLPDREFSTPAELTRAAGDM